MKNVNNQCLKSNKVAGDAEKFNFIPSIEDVDFNRDYLFTNLDCFGVDPENRPSTKEDIIVRRYAKLMLDGKWFYDLSPLYVGINNLFIANGEHRRKAIKLAIEKGIEQPIVHVRFFDDGTNLKEKREVLNGGKHWNSDDYVEALVSAGNSDFIFLRDFCLDEDHPQLHSTKGKPYYNKGAIVLGSTYKEFKDAYLSGIWGIKHQDIAVSEKRYTEMVRIKKALKYDAAGQDCWIYIGEAWNEFSKANSEYASRIKNLPDGIESFYDALKYIDNTNSNKPSEWLERFVKALDYAEKHA